MKNKDVTMEDSKYDAICFEKIIKTLNDVGIKTEIINKDEYGFSRTIDFKVYEIEYRIVWFINESTLYIGGGVRAAQIPFKYIYIDRTYPLFGGNKSVAFSYVKNKKESIFDREFPFGCFRIPIEINNK